MILHDKLLERHEENRFPLDFNTSLWYENKLKWNKQCQKSPENNLYLYKVLVKEKCSNFIEKKKKHLGILFLLSFLGICGI